MNNRLDYIKREIKRTYKKYRGESDDGIASIQDVARFFDIPVDESRLSDYYIDEIDFDEPSIIIVDSATRTTHKSEYTEKVNFGDIWRCCDTRFIYVTSSNPLCKVERVYSIPCYSAVDRFITAQITLKKDGLELILRKDGKRMSFFDDFAGFTVGYDKIVQDKLGEKRQHLLTKSFRKFATDGGNDTLSQMYTYDLNHFINYDDEQDIFVYGGPKGVVYGINDFDIKDENGKRKEYIGGFCFENLVKYRRERLPLPWCVNSFDMKKSELYGHKTTSSIYLKGFDERGTWGYFEAYKSVEGLHIKYNLVMSGSRITLVKDDFMLPSLAPGCISIEEIDSIIEVLRSKYIGDKFIEMIVRELLEFRRKICINRGLTPEEEDPLSPKRFADMPIEAIEKEILEDRDGYFALAEEQFQKSTHIEPKALEDIKSFRMKPIKPRD